MGRYGPMPVRVESGLRDGAEKRTIDGRSQGQGPCLTVAWGNALVLTQIIWVLSRACVSG